MSEDSDHPDQSPPVLNYLPPAEEARMVRLRVFPSPFEANLAAAKLRSEGLVVQLGGEARQAGIGTYGAISDGIDLYVLSDQVETANSILQAIETSRAKQASAQRRCPKCGSEKIAGYDPGRRKNAFIILAAAIMSMLAGSLLNLPEYTANDLSFVGIVGIFVGVFLLIRCTWQYSCRNCGNVWKPDSSEADGDDA